jgi:protocatechuate 3,4-dioxygenase beta subunit
MASGLISRRALILAAPVLLLPGAALAALAPTPGSSEGPFYPVQYPRDDDWDLVRSAGSGRRAGGDILHLTGRVLDRSGRPLAAARVEIWQCDANGVYLHPGDARSDRWDTGFQGFGHAMSDTEGRFAFRTIVPVPYPGRTTHIHVKVIHRDRAVLITQLYRAGFPGNGSDFLFRRLDGAERKRVSMVITPRRSAPGPAFETNMDLVVA